MSWRSPRFSDGAGKRFGDYMRLKGIFPMNGDGDIDDDDYDDYEDEDYVAPADRGMYTICGGHGGQGGVPHHHPGPHALDAVLEITKQVGHKILYRLIEM